MIRRLSYNAIVLALIAVSAIAVPGAAADQVNAGTAAGRTVKPPPTINDVVQTKRFPETRISADGKQVAFVVTEPSVARNTVTSRLMVADTDTPDKARTVTTLTSNTGRITDIAWAGADRLSYQAPAAGADEVWTVPLSGAAPKVLFDSPVPAVAVGGQSLPFFDGVTGTEPQHQARVLHHDWSPDQKKVAFTAPRLIGTPDTTGGVVYDDKKMGIQSFVDHQYRRGRFELWVNDPATHRLRHITDLSPTTPKDGTGPSVAWSADGKRIELYSLSSGVAETVDPATGAVSTVDPKTLTAAKWRQSLPNTSAGACFAISVDVQGDRASCAVESATAAPRLVTMDAASVRQGYAPNTWPSARNFQRPVAQRWTNKYGRSAPGAEIVPTGCHRCPAVIITHGAPGDTFMDEDFEPEFPSQVFAAHGYVVLMVGESGIAPGPGSDWEQTEQHLGLDAVATMEAAAKSAIDNGTVDPEKIGIMGFSRGAEVTQLALSHSTMFSAASSGDGGSGTGGYWQLGVSGPPAQLLDGAYGGSPGDSKAQQHWKDMAPDLNADRINAPMLFQSTDSTAQIQMQLYEYVKARKVPTELIAFPGESHEFNQPAGRVAAMNRNVDWFDYWLRDRREDNPLDAEQYSRWDAMRAAWH